MRGASLADARVRDQSRQVVVPHREPRLVVVQRVAQRRCHRDPGERLDVVGGGVLQLCACAQRTHRRVGELAGPVRRAHHQPLDRDLGAVESVRAASTVPALMRGEDASGDRLVEAEPLRHPRARDEVPALVADGDAGVVQ